LAVIGADVATEMSVQTIRTLRNLSIIKKAFEIIERNIKLVLDKRHIFGHFFLRFLSFFCAEFSIHGRCELQDEYDRKIYIIILKQLTKQYKIYKDSYFCV
jgi:hypothetical protein